MKYPGAQSDRPQLPAEDGAIVPSSGGYLSAASQAPSPSRKPVKVRARRARAANPMIAGLLKTYEENAETVHPENIPPFMSFKV
ncbi:MAG: hypothetical protein ACLFVU_06890 [Phycisphaerae bacterium]